jgi:hypothetical protein
VNRHALAAISLAAVLSPCATAYAVTQDARTRDSSGVTIVENPARKDAPVRFRLGDKPLMEVGGVEPNRSEEFEHNQGYLRGVRLSTGGLAVIDVSRVHYFDPNGKRTRIVGRGQGPQEFEYITAICRTRGDTLILSDRQFLSVLNPRGDIVLTIPRGEFGSAPFSFCLDDGSFVLEQTVEGNARQTRVTRLRTDGSTVNTVGSFPRPTLDMVTMAWTTVVAAGNEVYYGHPFTGDISVYNALGELRRIVRTADRGDSITVEEAEQRMDQTIPLNVLGADRKERMDRMRSRPYAKNWPVFSRIEVATDGTIWVQDFRKTSETPDAWTAIDSTGRVIGRLVFPARDPAIRFDLQSFGADYVTLRRFNADKTSSLAVVPLVRLDGRSR